MIRITCYIRPHQLEGVKSAVASLGVTGMTVSDVRGTGNSPESTDWFGGDESLVALPIRSKLLVVAEEELVEEIVQAIVDHAQTGESGDGKVFVERVSDAVRIRTEERGAEAI